MTFGISFSPFCFSKLQEKCSKLFFSVLFTSLTARSKDITHAPYEYPKQVGVPGRQSGKTVEMTC